MADRTVTGPLPVSRPNPTPRPQRDARRLSRVEAAKADAAKAKADAERAASDASARVAEAQARSATAAAEARSAEARATAEAAASKALADRVAAETKSKQDAIDRGREAMPWQIGASAAALPAGVAAGAIAAKMIDTRQAATIAARNKEIAALGKQADAALKKVPAKGVIGRVTGARLAGIVATADKLDLGKMRGPAGLVPAALLLAEGALVRFAIAPQIQDERARAVAGGVASASVFAATNLIGERMVQNATPKALPSAKALSSIEAARQVVSGPATKAVAAKAAPAAASTLARVAGTVLSRGVPIVAAGIAAVQIVRGYQKDGAKGAAMAGADALTFGLASAGAAYLTKDAAAKASAPAAPAVRSVGNTAFGRGWRNGRGFANRRVQQAAQAARLRVGK